MTILDSDDWSDEDLQELIVFAVEYGLLFEANDAPHAAPCIEAEADSDSEA